MNKNIRWEIFNVLCLMLRTINIKINIFTYIRRIIKIFENLHAFQDVYKRKKLIFV